MTDRFSTLVTQEFNQVEYNHAKVGGSNDRIWRTTLNGCIEHTPKLVIIMWSGVNRQEYLAEGGFFTKDLIIAGEPSYDTKSKFRDAAHRWRQSNWVDFKMSNHTLKIGEASKLGKDPDQTKKHYEYLNGYAKYIRTVRWNLKYTIAYMLSTKYFLEARNIPYLFYLFSAGQYKPFLYLLDEFYVEAANNVWASLELSKKQILKELPVLKTDGFYDIVKKAKLPIGEKDHPLEEGHRLMADIIIKDIKKYEYDKKLY
ncbi:MAG: hypothetical protein CL489_02450 [Acidobacteria bacterium]|nr:hypothetical protein [Acidobacteriota bacterium]